MNCVVVGNAMAQQYVRRNYATLLSGLSVRLDGLTFDTGEFDVSNIYIIWANV